MADLSPYTMNRIAYFLAQKQVNLAIEVLQDEARNRFPSCPGDCRTTIQFKKLARQGFVDKMRKQLNIHHDSE